MFHSITPENVKMYITTENVMFSGGIEISQTLSTYQCLQMGVCDFLKFYLDVELFAKVKKDLVSTNSFFTVLLITQDLNKIKQVPKTLL